MKKRVKIISFILALCMVFCLSACVEGSNTGISGLSIESLSNKEFYSGTTYDDLKLTVNNTSEYEASDVNVVIADDSIIDITFEKKDTLFSKYISFDIICKTVGTTTFYFETSDKVVKSEEVEITVLANIKSISFDNTSDITFYDWEDDVCRTFEIDSNRSISDPQSVLEFVSDNPDVATIEYDEDDWLFRGCIIKKVGIGETYVYIQTKDKAIRSQKIKVIIEEDEPEEDVEEDNSYVEDEPVDNSRTVYITPYGKKYHYSKSCAGSNASATTEDAAKTSRDPCKKCVQ